MVARRRCRRRSIGSLTGPSHFDGPESGTTSTLPRDAGVRPNCWSIAETRRQASARRTAERRPRTPAASGPPRGSSQSSGTGGGTAPGLWRRRAWRLSTAELGVPARAGDHVGAKLGAGGQDAVDPEQVKPGRGNEDAELLDQLQRIEQQVRRAVAARVGPLVQELPPGALRQALWGQGRAQQVAAGMIVQRPTGDKRTPASAEASRGERLRRFLTAAARRVSIDAHRVAFWLDGALARPGVFRPRRWRRAAV
jgi:hypothetical protein